jgi:DtxR family Mn-dependent transcriptional regulator
MIRSRAPTSPRVSDSDPAMPRHLAQCGMAVGDRVEVLDAQPFDGPLRVQIGDAVRALGTRLAEAMRVEAHG